MVFCSWLIVLEMGAFWRSCMMGSGEGVLCVSYVCVDLTRVGSVCDDEFNLNAANAVCSQLYGTAAHSYKQSFGRTFGEHDGLHGQIWLDNLKCSDSATGASPVSRFLGLY